MAWNRKGWIWYSTRRKHHHGRFVVQNSYIRNEATHVDERPRPIEIRFLHAGASAFEVCQNLEGTQCSFPDVSSRGLFLRVKNHLTGPTTPWFGMRVIQSIDFFQRVLSIRPPIVSAQFINSLLRAECRCGDGDSLQTGYRSYNFVHR